MIRIDFVESSLPGIGCVKRDGSELLSTRAITGTLSRLASAIAMASLWESITNTAPGRPWRFSIPSKLRCMRAICLLMAAPSFPGSLSRLPSSSIRRNFLYFARLVETVSKLVRVPPIQRFTQKGIFVAAASSLMGSWACRLVPTSKTCLPWETTSSIALEAFSSWS